jgi:hypothetical protein
MSGDAQRVLAYMCECGKKWTFTLSDLTEEKSLKCRCGRNIVIRNGIVYGTEHGQ